MKISKTSKWIHRVYQSVLVIVIFICCVIAAGAGWLLLAPRESVYLTQKIEQSLNHPDSPYTLEIDNTILALGDIAYPLSVTVKEVSLLSREGEKVANIPSMHIALDAWKLLYGKVIPAKITLIQPNIKLYQEKKGIFYLSTEHRKKALALLDLFAAGHNEKKKQKKALFDDDIEEIAISSANLGFESKLGGIKLDIPAADIIIRQYKGVLRGRVDLKALQQNRKDASIEGYFTYEPAARNVMLRMEFKELNPADYAEILSQFSEVEGINLPLTGRVETWVSLPNTVEKLKLDLVSGEGKVVVLPYIPKPLTIKKVELKGEILQEKKSQLVIEKFLLQLKNAEINATTEILKSEQGLIEVKGAAKATKLTKKQLMQLWPEQFGAGPRQWVADSIVKANIPEANFVINAPFGSLDEPAIADELLEAKINVEKAEVDYLPGFPRAKEAKGKVTIKGNSLQVEVEAANILNATKLQEKGSVRIPSFSDEKMRIEVELPIISSAADVVEIINATPYKPNPELNFNAETIGGNVQGNLKMQITDNVSPQPDDVEFEAITEISQFNQPGFYKGIGIENATGKLKITDTSLEADVSGKAEGNPFAFVASVNPKAEKYHIKTMLTQQKLSEAGFKLYPYLSGPVGLDINWEQSTASQGKISGAIDLTNTILNIEEIDYLKPAGEVANLNIQGALKQGVLNINDFQLNIPDRKEELRGSASLSINTSSLQEINFTKVEFAGNKASGIYRPIPGGHYIHAKGEALDLSFRDKNAEEASTTKPRKVSAETTNEWEVPALDMQLDFKEVLISKDRKKKLYDMKLQAICDISICQRFSVSFNAGEQAPFNAKIKQQNNRRVFTAYTPRADIILREANIFDDMRDGEMQVIGLFQDELPTHPLIGKLTIGPHHVKNVPVLTKLLTVATFTGIVDALSGGGLMFQKLVVPFRKEGMLLQLQEAKTAGPSIGITAGGSINIANDTINLRGTIIPAYMFNALIKSIPVLGNIFGVLAGDGLVAMRYSMLGNLENPNVTVNPLSALTPGFLRSFFSIFESDDPQGKQGIKVNEAALRQLEEELEQIKPEGEVEGSNSILPASSQGNSSVPGGDSADAYNVNPASTTEPVTHLEPVTSVPMKR